MAAEALAVTVDELAELDRASQAASAYVRAPTRCTIGTRTRECSRHLRVPSPEIRRHCFGGPAAIISSARPLRPSG